MANRRPRPGDRALVLPPLTSGEQYEGTICSVHSECWEPNRAARAIIDISKSMGYDTGKINIPINLDKPFWHCTLMDGVSAHVHEDNLEPIDPDHDESEVETGKKQPATTEG